MIPEEEALEQVPAWHEAESIHIQFVQCPMARYGLCNFSTSFVEEDDEDEAKRLYEDHWRDHHG